MKEAIFNLFSGTTSKDGVWLESVTSLDAIERMVQIAAKRVGSYFVFSSQSHAILARIKTFTKRESLQRSKMVAPKQPGLSSQTFVTGVDVGGTFQTSRNALDEFTAYLNR